MGFFVTVSFDLTHAPQTDYDKIKQSLATLGLRRTVPSIGGEVIALPRNTFVGIRNTPDAKSTLETVTNEIRCLSLFEGLRGRVFVSVAANTIYDGFAF
jgi:hypothetical protein